MTGGGWRGQGMEKSEVKKLARKGQLGDGNGEG